LETYVFSVDVQGAAGDIQEMARIFTSHECGVWYHAGERDDT